MNCHIGRAMMFAVVLAIVPCASEVARAETIRIVALGASNTNSYGVSVSEGWPAKLERMLRAKGFDVKVVVSANNGDGTAAILGRVDSVVTPGTRVVVYDSGERNDIRRGVPAGVARANAAQIQARIRARGAVAGRGGLAGPAAASSAGRQEQRATCQSAGAFKRRQSSAAAGRRRDRQEELGSERTTHDFGASGSCNHLIIRSRISRARSGDLELIAARQ